MPRQMSAPNWDGYGAAPVTTGVIDAARRFLAAIPETWPVPEVSAEPDGELCFEWARAPHWVFSVSVSGEGRLSYAGLFGASRAHGVEFFAGTLPEAVVVNLERLFRAPVAPMPTATRGTLRGLDPGASVKDRAAAPAERRPARA
mgnify:FL=1